MWNKSVFAEFIMESDLKKLNEEKVKAKDELKIEWITQGIFLHVSSVTFCWNQSSLENKEDKKEKVKKCWNERENNIEIDT